MGCDMGCKVDGLVGCLVSLKDHLMVDLMVGDLVECSIGHLIGRS